MHFGFIFFFTIFLFKNHLNFILNFDRISNKCYNTVLKSTEVILNKLFITLFILVLSAICFMNSIESQIGSKFINTVSKEITDAIANTEEVLVTDIRTTRRLNISLEQLKSFKSYVTKDSSYIFDMNKRCVFVPQLVFEFKGSPNVTIFVSMICNQIKIISGDKSIILDYDLVKDEFNTLNEELIKQ